MIIQTKPRKVKQEIPKLQRIQLRQSPQKLKNRYAKSRLKHQLKVWNQSLNLAEDRENTEKLFGQLQTWKGMLDNYPELSEKFTEFMTKYIDLQEKIVSEIEDENQQARQLLQFARRIKQISDRISKADDLLNRALRISDEMDITDEIHKELGHVKYNMPTGEEWDQIQFLKIAKDKLLELQMREGRLGYTF